MKVFYMAKTEELVREGVPAVKSRWGSTGCVIQNAQYPNFSAGIQIWH